MSEMIEKADKSPRGYVRRSELMVLIDVYNNEPCNDARKTDEPVALGAPAVASRILHQGYPLRNECHDLGSPFV